MTSASTDQRCRRFSFRMTIVLLAMLPLLLMPGCGGCSKDDPAAAKKRAEEEKRKKEEEEKKKKERKKPRFELGRLRVQPTDEDTTLNFVKYGHWHTGSQRMRANHEDFLAEISSQAVDKYQRPINVENTNFQMKMTRPASLPKGQIMNFEMIYFIPPSMGREGKNVSLHSQLHDRRSGRGPAGTPQPTTGMKGYQHFFLVLAANEKKYMFLKNLDSISAPPGNDDDADRLLYYRVMLPEIKKRVPVPSHPLTWTAMAYILWDGLIPNRVNPDQQQALLDWLHWGGQLIVSGPNSLDTLRGSFLDDYLPATATESVKLKSVAFKNMSDSWTVYEQKKQQKQPMKVSDERPLLGVDLAPHEDSVVLIESGDNEPKPMVVERRIGRGRIVVTAFNLSDEPIVNWGTTRGNFDNFFNAVLLRRPSREYGVSDETLMPQLDFLGYGSRRKDPRLLTTLRYFSRDMGRIRPVQNQQRPQGYIPNNLPYGGAIDVNTPPPDDPNLTVRDTWHYGGFESDPYSGVGGWNDSGGAAAAARTSLNEAAGISVPESSFVLRALLVYIVVLVPINWGFFWLIGRVEWAWVAAPLIAIAGAMGVIHYAQLDIGFARSRTEIAVLEMYGGHQRGHLTRYTALYTSLSTFYDFEFADKSAVAQPFSPHNRPSRDSSVSTVSFRREKNVSFKGFKVQSNDIGHVHSEQMYAMGGALKLTGGETQGFQVDNTTQLGLQGVGIIRRTDSGEYEAAWIGELPAQKTSAQLRFKSVAQSGIYLPEWEQSDVTKTVDDNPDTGDVPDGEVNVSRLIKLATQKLRLATGEVRLIGWTDKDIGGVKITPAASQVTLRTFVVAHLRPGKLPSPGSDTNTKSDYWEEPDEELDLFEGEGVQQP